MPNPPANIVPPSISPNPAKLNDQLTASPGTWTTDSNEPITYSYQWFSFFYGPQGYAWYGGTNAPNDQGNTRYLQTSSLGWDVKVIVTATSAGFSATASAQIGPIYGPPSPVETPSLSGQPVVGGLIVLDPKAWRLPRPSGNLIYPSERNPEIQITWEWQRSPDGQNWTMIPDQTNLSLALSADLLGDYIRASVTGSYWATSQQGAYLQYHFSQERTVIVPRVVQNGRVVDGFVGPILASSAAPQIPPPAPSNSEVAFRLLVHIQSFGDSVVQNNQFGGTRGQALRLEGFQINIDPAIQGLSCRYMAHVQNIGDLPWVDEGQFVGTRGQSLRLEGFAIELTGPAAGNYNVSYMAHLEHVGDTAIFSNGQFCGTRGQSRRVEGMLVRIQPK